MHFYWKFVLVIQVKTALLSVFSQVHGEQLFVIDTRLAIFDTRGHNQPALCSSEPQIALAASSIKTSNFNLFQVDILK